MLMTQKIIHKKKIYFIDMANEWLLYKKLSVKTSTYYNYRYMVEKYLKERFDKISIEKLIGFNMNELILEFSDSLSAKTIKAIVSVFISILNFSEEKYKCKFNLSPFAIPKVPKKELEILTEEEQMKIEKFCLNNGDKRYFGIILSLYTGLRIGELCALTWENIDLRNRTIFITKTLQRIYVKKKSTKILIDSPKSNNSVRRIPMNDKVYEMLKEAKPQNSNAIFFLSGTNKYIEPRRYQYIFNNILKLLNIKEYNFHILRHTFATNCIKVGMDAKSLSEILGHATVTITLNKYVHSSDKIKKKFLQKL